MKKVILLLAAWSLASCVSLQFDSLEYDRYVTIKEIVDHSAAQCQNPEGFAHLGMIKTIMDHQYLYASYHTTKPEVAEAATNLKGIVDSFYLNYDPQTSSVGYCQSKLKNISIGVTAMIRTLGHLD